MINKKLKLEELQIKGFVTDLSSGKQATHNFKGGWSYASGGGGGTGASLRCDDWGTEEGTRFCTDPQYCRTEYDCPTEWPDC